MLERGTRRKLSDARKADGGAESLGGNHCHPCNTLILEWIVCLCTFAILIENISNSIKMDWNIHIYLCWSWVLLDISNYLSKFK